MQFSKPETDGITPPQLHKHTCTLVNSKLFIIGGYNITDQGDKIFNDLIVFDTETMYWYSPYCTGVSPSNLSGHSATNSGDGRIFIFGGSDGNEYYNDVFILNTNTFEWSNAKVSGDIPSARSCHSSTAVGNKIYIFGGGQNNTPLNDVYTLDTEKLAWTYVKAKGEAPMTRGYHTASLIGDKIAILGGSDTQNCFSDMSVLDTTSNTWSSKKLPSSKCRYAHSCTLVGFWLFLFGGSDGSSYVDDLEFLNLETYEWMKISVTAEEDEAPTPRGYHTAVLHDSRLFVFGGRDNETVFNDLFILDLSVHAYLPLLPAKLI